MPCLYTKQLTKKRKTFQDGLLKVNPNTGCCRLFKAADAAASSSANDFLESVGVAGGVVKNILDGEYTEITFETYFVTVERPTPMAAASRPLVQVHPLLLTNEEKQSSWIPTPPPLAPHSHLTRSRGSSHQPRSSGKCPTYPRLCPRRHRGG